MSLQFLSGGGGGGGPRIFCNLGSVPGFHGCQVRVSKMCESELLLPQF